MRKAQTPLEPKRFQRIMRWVRAFFGWYVRSCALWLASGGRASPRDLDRVAWLAGMVVFHHVATRITPRGSGTHRHGRITTPKGRGHRQLIGSRLRKAMRGRDFDARMYAILCVMRDLEKHIARAMRRLRCGLTRLRVIDPVACADACVAQAAPPVALADSS